MMRYVIGRWWKSLPLWQFTAVVETWHSTKLSLQQLRTQLHRLDIQPRYERNLCNAVNGPRLRSYNTVHMPDYKHKVWNKVSEGKVCGNLFIFSYFLSEDTLLLQNFVGDWCDGNMNVPAGQCMIVRLLYFLLSLFQWFSIFNLIILCIVVKISDGAQKNVLFCTMSDSASVIFPSSTVHTTYPPHSRHSHAPTLS